MCTCLVLGGEGLKGGQDIALIAERARNEEQIGTGHRKFSFLVPQVRCSGQYGE